MRKRIDIVSLKLCRDRSIYYEPRKVISSKDCYLLLKAFLEDKAREEFIVLALNTKCEPTAIEICSKGTAENSLVHPKEVFKMAILSNANQIIVAHNHPSGAIKPSNQDILVTTNLIESSKVLNIPLLDHIIIGEDKYFSFADEGLI